MTTINEKKIEQIQQTLYDKMDLFDIRSALAVLYGENEEKSLTELLKDAIEDLIDEYGGFDINDSAYDYINDYAHDFADSNTPIYNSDVINWYAKDPRRLKYADDGIAEFGRGGNGGILETLQLGIYMCLEQFALSILEELIEDNEDEDEEE